MIMRVGRNPVTDEGELYLDSEECELMKDLVRGANLALRRKFHKILTEL